MSKSSTMFIAFPNGGILPADIAGGKETPVAAHEPVRVPRSYGEHLVSDRFAYETEAPKRKQNGGDARAAEIAARIDALRADLLAAADDAEKERIAREIEALETEAAGQKG